MPVGISMNFTTLKSFVNKFRRGNGDIHIPEDLTTQSNVWLTARERGKIVARRESHNVVTDGGRQWLRGLVGSLAYPGIDVPGVGVYTQDMNVNAFDAGSTNVQVDSKYRPRYICFGVGGSLQGITPPGQGSFTEVTTRLGLEAPVLVEAGWWARQLSGQDLADLDFAPNNYTIRFRRIIYEDMISFAAQPTYGTSVPLSEIGMLHSGYNPTDNSGGLLSDVNCPIESQTPTGFIAYNTFATITKTPLFQLEVIWEWRF